MSSPREDFTQLRKLLSCKRYEQPPPGYLDHLRKKVMGKLAAEDLEEYSSWWRWLVEKFDAKPVLVCIYGVVVSGLLLAGFRISEFFESDVAATPVFGGPWLALTPGSTSAFPEDLEQGNGSDVYFTTFVSLSKRAQPVFSMDRSPLVLNDVSGLRFSPISPAVSGH